MWKYKTVAIDYDGTLVEDIHPATNGSAMFGAPTVTHLLRRDGWEILIFTCRPSHQRKEIEENLKMRGIVFDHISFYGKPVASLYIDDKGFRFEGDWLSTYEWIKERDTCE